MILKNKKYLVKLVPEKVFVEHAAISPDHVGKYIFPTCKVSFTLPLSGQNGGLVKIFSNEEIAELEKLLGREQGELSFYKDKNNFWHTFVISLDENPLPLDLNNPMDIVRYGVIKAQSFVAPSWDNRLDKPEYRWVIVEEGEEVQTTAKTSDLKIKAYLALDKIRDNTQKMIDVFKIMGKIYPENTDKTVLFAHLTDIVESNKINDFLNAIDDENAVTKIFISDLKNAGELTYKKGNYFLKDGTLIGSLDETLMFFLKPENSELKLVLKARLQK